MKYYKAFYIFAIIIIFEIAAQTYYFFLNESFLYNRINLPIFSKSSNSCWGLKKNLNFKHSTSEFNYNIITNNQGFRVGKPSKKKYQYDQNDLIFLGSNFSFGRGNSYEKTFINSISRYFENYNFKNFINASIPAHLPDRQLCWFIKEGYKFKPKILIHTISNLDLRIKITNDLDSYCNSLSKCMIHNYFANSKGYLIPDEKNFKDYIKNLAIVYYVWSFYLKAKIYYSHEIKNNDLNNKNILIDKRYLEQFIYYDSIIRKLSPNTKIMFIYIPPSYHISYLDKFRFNKSVNNIHEEIKFNSKLTSILEKKFLFINTTNALKNNFLKNNIRLYHLIDASLNSSGNEIIFDEFRNYCELKKCYR